MCRVCEHYPEDEDDERFARWHFDRFGEILPSRRVYDDGRDVTDELPPERWPLAPDGRQSSRSRR